MLKKKEDRRKIWIFILISIALFFIFFYTNKIPQPSGRLIQPNITENPRIDINGFTGIVQPSGGALMSYQLYDSNGNLITTSNSLSIVDNVPGVSSIGLSVSAQSTITSPNLLCTPTTVWDSSPSNTAFDTALTDKSTKVLTSGGIIYWSTPVPMSTTQFESSEFTYFNVTLTCTFTIGGNTYNPTFNGFLAVNITNDNSSSSASVIVSIFKGGAPTSFCGDLVCNNATSPPDLSEDSTTCPADCAAPVINAKFRTTSNIYGSSSAIAYTSSCGSVLGRYGFYSSSSPSTSGNCLTKIATTCNSGGSPVLLFTVPGGWKSGGAAPALWRSGDSTQLCICDDDGSISQTHRYRPNVGNYDLVSESSLYTDTNSEVSC